MSNEMSLSDPKPEQTENTLKEQYDPRDQIIANLSIEVERLKKRLIEYSTAMRVTEALRKALDQFAQFRSYHLY